MVPRAGCGFSALRAPIRAGPRTIYLGKDFPMQRKDVRVGMVVGGILVAVLIVALLIPGKKPANGPGAELSTEGAVASASDAHGTKDAAKPDETAARDKGSDPFKTAPEGPIASAGQAKPATSDQPAGS